MGEEEVNSRIKLDTAESASGVKMNMNMAQITIIHKIRFRDQMVDLWTINKGMEEIIELVSKPQDLMNMRILSQRDLMTTNYLIMMFCKINMFQNTRNTMNTEMKMATNKCKNAKKTPQALSIV